MNELLEILRKRDDVIDLGSDHFIEIMYEDDKETIIASLVLYHPNLKDETQVCSGYSEVGPGEWEILTIHPLSVYPSFVCNECRDHGIIRKGEWRSAGWDNSEHQIPLWLRFALKGLCSSGEEMNHIYYRPIPEYDYASPMDFVTQKNPILLTRWLEEEYEKKRKEKERADLFRRLEEQAREQQDDLHIHTG